jgi:hypothetical protein
MAKQNELVQMNLFPFNPAIKNLGIVDVKLKGGLLEIEMAAATEAMDLAMIQPEQWVKAVAEWLVRLTDGDFDVASRMLGFAHSQFCQERCAREAIIEEGYARSRDAIM